MQHVLPRQDKGRSEAMTKRWTCRVRARSQQARKWLARNMHIESPKLDGMFVRSYEPADWSYSLVYGKHDVVRGGAQTSFRSAGGAGNRMCAIFSKQPREGTRVGRPLTFCQPFSSSTAFLLLWRISSSRGPGAWHCSSLCTTDVPLPSASRKSLLAAINSAAHCGMEWMSSKASPRRSHVLTIVTVLWRRTSSVTSPSQVENKALFLGHLK